MSKTLRGFYKVEKIVGKKVYNGQILYEVKWLNYPSSTNTYYPIENLENAIEAVRNFEDSLSKKKARQGVRRKKRNQHAITYHVKMESTNTTAAGSPKLSKSRTLIRKARRYSGNSKLPVIFLPTSQRPVTHWVFGHILNRIVKATKDGYEAEWDNGKITIESLRSIELHQPYVLEKFNRRTDKMDEEDEVQIL